MTDRSGPGGDPGEEAPGGDPACWVDLVCDECGAVAGEGHREGCGAVDGA